MNLKYTSNDFKHLSLGVITSPVALKGDNSTLPRKMTESAVTELRQAFSALTEKCQIQECREKTAGI